MLLLSLLTSAHAVDLVVDSVEIDCSTVTVTVKNQSPIYAPAFFIDVFRDEPAAPEMGEIGEQFFRISGIPPWGRASHSFEFFDAGWQGQMDVLLDTGEDVTELRESNNHFDLFASFVCHPR